MASKGGASTRTAKQEHAYYEVWKRRKAGDLPRPSGRSCSKCGAPATESHHADYAKGGAVSYMCASCNRKLGKGKNA